VVVWIHLTAEVLQRGEAGESDRDVDDAVAPGPAERIADDHRDFDAEALSQTATDRVRRAVRIERLKAHDLALADVRRVDAGVGTDKAAPGLTDDDARVHANDARALAQNDLDLSGILARHTRGVPSKRRRLDRAQ